MESGGGGDELHRSRTRLFAIARVNESDVVELGRSSFLPIMDIDDGKAPAFAATAAALSMVCGKEAMASILVVARGASCSGLVTSSAGFSTTSATTPLLTSVAAAILEIMVPGVACEKSGVTAKISRATVPDADWTCAS